MLQPVNRLPSEIFSCITRCLLHKDHALDARSIIPLTHVCRYWRESITSVPANWTLISNSNKELTALSLERAKAAPLEVCLNTERGDLGFFHPPAPYAQNIGTLQVAGCAAIIEKLREAIPGFPQSTPNLRSMSLMMLGPDVGLDRSIDPFETLPSTLRRLALYEIPLYPSLLRLGSLTELTLDYDDGFDLHLDTLLDFLEENHLLDRATLTIRFREASLRSSRRRTPIESRLRFLSIDCRDVVDGQALISNVTLRRGAHLDITLTSADGRLNDILSGVSTTHFLNLCSPAFMEYRSYHRDIQLFGPNGGFSFGRPYNHGGDVPFSEFPLLPLTHVREFRFIHRTPERETTQRAHDPLVFHQSSFPALETLAVDCETCVSHLLSALFSNPSSPPSLKTLAFMDCFITGDFMEELTQYASRRKATTSAWLYKVVIVNSNGVFPTITSIRKLKEHVPVVDVKVGTVLPMDLI